MKDALSRPQTELPDELFVKFKTFKGQSGHLDSVSALVYDEEGGVLYTSSLDHSIKVHMG